MARKKVKHKVGDVWRATRKVGKGKAKRQVIVKKVAKDKYKVRVVSPKNKHVNTGRSYLLDRAYPYRNKSETWENR